MCWRSCKVDKKNNKKKTLYVIGTGPSLKETDMSLLKDKDTITFNRAYVAYEDWGFNPTYYMCIDANDLRSIYGDLNKLILSTPTKFFICDTTDNDNHDPEDFWEEEWVSDQDMIVNANNVHRIIDNMPENHKGVINNFDWWLSLDPGRKAISANILPNAGIMAMHLAMLFLAYDEVAFVGCDCRYKNDEESNKFLVKKGKSFRSTEDYDVNHFRDDYFGRNITFGVPNQAEVIYMWARFSEQLRGVPDDKFKVYSCTPNSNANQFYDYIPLEDFVKGSRTPTNEPETDYTYRLWKKKDGNEYLVKVHKDELWRIEGVDKKDGLSS